MKILIQRVLSYLKINFYKLFFPSNLKIEGYCSQCGVCCQKIHILIGYKVVTKEDEFFKLQRDFPSYNCLEISGQEESGELFFKCNLFKDNKCLKYKQRPLICRQYPSVNMLKYGGVLNESCTFQLKPKKSFGFYLKNARRD